MAITLSEQNLVEFDKFLGEMPFKYANPIVAFLNTLSAEQNKPSALQETSEPITEQAN